MFLTVVLIKFHSIPLIGIGRREPCRSSFKYHEVLHVGSLCLIFGLLERPWVRVTVLAKKRDKYTFVSVRLSEVVPNGLLVFFPCYPFLSQCVDAWQVKL